MLALSELKGVGVLWVWGSVPGFNVSCPDRGDSDTDPGQEN